MQEIDKLDDIIEPGRYCLKGNTNIWIEIKKDGNSLIVYGPIGRKNCEEMFLTQSGEIRKFSKMSSLINALKNYAKRGHWNLKTWIIKDPYSERLICDNASIERIENRWVYVRSERGLDSLRLGCDCPSDIQLGEIGKLWYVTDHCSGLVKFRR